MHVHLDGSYPRAAVLQLAQRKGVAFEAPRAFGSVADFFSAYLTVPDLIDTLDELSELCLALVAEEASQGVVYLEPAIEPQLFAPRLGDLRTVTGVILDAFAAGAAEQVIEVGANLTINTEQDLPLAMELARLAAELAGNGVTALGTAGFEEPAGLGRFRQAADVARHAGLPVVAHAGQTGGPDSILEALDVLGATRLSHGFRAIESPDLVRRLVDEQIVLDVCPVSNVSLKVTRDLESHPARELARRGVPITLNADDQLWFGCGINDQYEIAHKIWGFDDAEIAELAAHGSLVTGMSETTRASLLSAADRWPAGHPHDPGTGAIA